MKVFLKLHQNSNGSYRAKSVSNQKDGKEEKTNLPAINNKTILEEDEEDKGPINRFVRKRGISQVARRQLQITNRVQNIGKPKRKVFTINTYPSRSELETLQCIIEKNDWEETCNPMEGHLIWFGLPLREADFKLLQKRPNVIFNKYPGSEYLCRKKTLSSLLARMKRYFPEEYNFAPREYLYPEEEEIIEKYITDHPANWMIAKPSRGCGGCGIFLFKGQFNPPYSSNEFVIQKYISKPLLVEKKKFDLRLYVLIKSFDPLECYFCNEGLVRFCTEDYKRPTKDNSKELCMHLTNFCLNKENVNYINPQEYGDDNRGSKRLLSKFFQQLERDSNFDQVKVKNEIINTIKKTIICLIPYLKNSSKRHLNQDLGKINCFQMIGIDIMLDHNCKAWLMEINANPSFNMYLERENEKGEFERTLSELDKYLKTLVINDALKIVRSKKPVDDLGCYEQILPSPDEEFQRYYVWDKARSIFDRLAGVKKADYLTASQFQKLGRFPELTRPHFLKAHYDIVFKEATRKNETNYMTCDDFFCALDLIVAKMYSCPANFENLIEYLSQVDEVIK